MQKLSFEVKSKELLYLGHGKVTHIVVVHFEVLWATEVFFLFSVFLF